MEKMDNLLINELLSSPVGEKLSSAMMILESVQRRISSYDPETESSKLSLLKIGTVFQIFLIDTLASGKKVSELSKDDWQNIAMKVAQYAVLPDGQSYTEFVFTLYADYIDISVDCFPESIRERHTDAIESIKALADTLRENQVRLHIRELAETSYVEACLWVSLEGMVKLLSLWVAMALEPIIGTEFTQLPLCISQLAFEYGRYVLYAKEQAILTEYIEHQCVLDEALQRKYDAYAAELNEYACQFQSLIDKANSADIQSVLLQSAELARMAGVAEDELLQTTDDVDVFFME